MFDAGRLHMPIGQAIILPLLLIALFGASPLSAQQRAETRGNQSPALIAGRDAIVTYGLMPEEVQELTKAAAAGAVGPLADKIVDLSKRLGVTENAALTLLHILDQEDVQLEQLPLKLGEVANQYKKFQAQLAALNPQNPLARRLAEQAETEIKAGRFEKAHQLLRQVTQAGIAAAQQARELRQKAQVAEDEQLIQAAASSSAEGDLSMTELHYLQAADLFKEAANLVPPGSAYEDKRIDYLRKEADALYQQGDEFGDGSVLRSAIERYNRLLELQPRERAPLEWATTQDKLGNALSTLGMRESGSARLEEAVVAFRDALKERARERAPHQWAATQNNLGNALAALGAREAGNARLEEAAAAYRDALQEDTRERMPLDWAMTQSNLGITLWMLGVRENSTTRLEEAVAAYRGAPRGKYPGESAVPMGHDRDRSWQCARHPWRAREQQCTIGRGRRGLSRRPQGTHARAQATAMGHHPDQCGQCARHPERARERQCATGRGHRFQSRGPQGVHARAGTGPVGWGPSQSRR